MNLQNVTVQQINATLYFIEVVENKFLKYVESLTIAAVTCPRESFTLIENGLLFHISQAQQKVHVRTCITDAGSDQPANMINLILVSHAALKNSLKIYQEPK